MILHHSCFPIDQNKEERCIFKHLPEKISTGVFRFPKFENRQRNRIETLGWACQGR